MTALLEVIHSGVKCFLLIKFCIQNFKPDNHNSKSGWAPSSHRMKHKSKMRGKSKILACSQSNKITDEEFTAAISPPSLCLPSSTEEQQMDLLFSIHHASSTPSRDCLALFLVPIPSQPLRKWSRVCSFEAVFQEMTRIFPGSCIQRPQTALDFSFKVRINEQNVMVWKSSETL